MISVLHGDCREILPTLGEPFHACVCDPPYHLTSGHAVYDLAKTSAGNPRVSRKTRGGGFMGKQWDGGDIAFRPETWRLVFDALLPGAYLVAFGGTRTYHRMVCAIEDAGFEVRETCMWLHGQGFPKSANAERSIDVELCTLPGRHFQSNLPKPEKRQPDDHICPSCTTGDPWEGWHSALKPAWEPIVVARRPLVGNLAENVLAHGTGALNIDACRIQVVDGQRPDTTLDEWEQDQFLCSSCVERAAHTKRPRTLATRASSATRHAAQTMSVKDWTRLPDTSRTVTGCCDGTIAASTGINSIIGAYGKPPTDPFLTDTSSITSTATSSTTSLRTCSACGDTITHKHTPSTRLRRNDAQQPPLGIEGTEPAARWPANVLHSGDEQVEAAFAAFGERRNGGQNATSKPSTGMFGNRRPPEGGSAFAGDSGTASRFFQRCAFSPDELRFHYSAKADAADRADSRHATVKPVSLLRWLVRLVTPPGGHILDPFAGSGTTGEAAMLEGFDCTLIEQDAKHVADIQHRIKRWSGDDTPLFKEAAE